MNNIYINEAESIFETFWDSGESYPNNEKYSCIWEYDITIKNPKTEFVKPVWNGVSVAVDTCINNEYSIVLKRNCDLDISDFDRLMFSATISEEVDCKIVCVIDGKVCDLELYNLSGGEKEAKISGKKLTEISISFRNTSDSLKYIPLRWLGLANYERREKMLARPNGYTSDWNGCIKDEFDFNVSFELFFSNEDLPKLRDKITREPFKSIVDKMRKFLEENKDFEPEKYIGRYVDFSQGPSLRTGIKENDGRKKFTNVMTYAALIGLLDKNADYVRLSCRCMLSLSCFEYWCENILGVFPTATWHHRAFLEGHLGMDIATCLSYVGDALTWHGKNLIYNSLIMKALPRLEADVKTMDYIWYMNQGIVFETFYIAAMIALEQRFPRYSPLIDEQERNLDVMWNNYILKDGGTLEGPAYWNYSAELYFQGKYLMSRRAKKSVPEYMGEFLDKTAKYGECMMSTIGNGEKIIPVNDGPRDHHFDLITLAFFVNNKNTYWNEFFTKNMMETDLISGVVEAMIVVDEELLKVSSDKSNLDMKVLPDTGIVCKKRNDTNLMLVSTGVLFGHSHQDKGAIIFESKGEGLLIDRGAVYGSRDGAKYESAAWHNVLVPYIDGLEKTQVNKEGYDGKIIYAKEDGDTIIMGSDNTDTWAEADKNLRFVIAPSSEFMIVYDIVKYKDKSAKSSFSMNSYYPSDKVENGFRINGEKNTLDVIPLNYIPEERNHGFDQPYLKEWQVNRMNMIASGEKLITALVLNSNEKPVFENNTVKYKNYTVELLENSVKVNGKEYTIFKDNLR